MAAFWPRYEQMVFVSPENFIGFLWWHMGTKSKRINFQSTSWGVNIYIHTHTAYFLIIFCLQYSPCRVNSQTCLLLIFFKIKWHLKIRRLYFVGRMCSLVWVFGNECISCDILYRGWHDQVYTFECWYHLLPTKSGFAKLKWLKR